MDYSIFKKTIKCSDGKTRSYWYYWYIDGDKQVQKACRGCKTKADAWAYVQNLLPVNQSGFKIKDVAKDMFLPNSDHVNRRQQLGKTVKSITMKSYRVYASLIIERWGEVSLHELSLKEVMGFLFKYDRSSSWKNRYLSVLKMIYEEGIFQGCNVALPVFQRFVKKQKKASTLSEEEIQALFKRENFKSDAFFYMFRLCLYGGLRLGEARAFRSCQLTGTQKIIINGFMSRNGERNPYNKGGSEENPKTRVSVIPQSFAAELGAYVRENDLYDNDLLFTNNGLPISQELAEKAFKSALTAAGLSDLDKKLVPHSLRYTWVTMLRRSVSKELVQVMAGHTTPEMTDYYTQLMTSDLSKSVDPVLAAVNDVFNL